MWFVHPDWQETRQKKILVAAAHDGRIAARIPRGTVLL
jgi:hypothetical protein